MTTARVSAAPKVRERMHWMDLLRGVAVLLVVLFHVPAIPQAMGATPPTWIMRTLDALAPYRVPTLLFLSGMLLQRSLSKGLPRYYMGKLRAVVWPLLVWTVITALAVGNPGAMADPWRWIGGSYHLWFLAVLAACYLVGPLTHWVPAWLWVVPMVLMSPIPSTNAYARILWFGAFFFAGAAAASRVDWWQSRRAVWPIILGVTAVAYGVWSSAAGVAHGSEHLRYFLPSLAGIAALLWIAPRLPRSPMLERAGHDSLVFYVAHFPAIALAWLLMERVGWPVDAWTVTLPVLLLVGIGVPLLLRPLRRTVLFQLPSRQGIS